MYKIKQAVNYGYMDFSTLEKRREACIKEFKLNKPVAPSIYLDVLPITVEKNGKLTVNGNGEVVEWCVYMHRFDEQNVLQRMAEEGELSCEISALLGKQIAEYHQQLQSTKDLDGASQVQSIINELEDFFTKYKFEASSNSYHEFPLKIKLALEKYAADINLRARNGFVRRCHGDLHLRNIVLLEDIPTPFDALEFSDELATIDVLYDLAFLIMDLLHLGLRKQANIVFNSYAYNAWNLIEKEGFAVMPLFLSIRSIIRAMTNIQNAACDVQHRKQALADSRKYMDEAISFLKPNRPTLLAVGGFSGTGKSTLVSSLAPGSGSHFGALHLRTDLERKQIFGVEEFTPLPEEAYKKPVSKKVYQRLLEKAEIALLHGQSVILDAVFACHDERQHVAELAKKLKVPLCGLWLYAPKEILLERVNKRVNDASDADEKVVENQVKKYPEIERNQAERWFNVDASGNVSKTLQNAQHIIEKEIKLQKTSNRTH